MVQNDREDKNPKSDLLKSKLKLLLDMLAKILIPLGRLLERGIMKLNSRINPLIEKYRVFDKKQKIVFWVSAVLVFLVLNSMIFTMDETRIAVITQFGRYVRTITEPGIKVKLPAPLHVLHYFDKRLLSIDFRPGEFLTSDKKNLTLEAFVCWKISDPRRFLETVRNRAGAEIRLTDLVLSEIGASIGSYPFSAIISVNPDEIKRDEIIAGVIEKINAVSKAQYGINVADTRFRRISLPEQTKESVYRRMRSEREQIAKKYRAEGKGRGMVIVAEADRKKREIISDAYRISEQLKGEGDAEATKIYTRAHNLDVNFYKFWRTLETYKKIFEKKTTMVLSADSELLKVLTRGGGE
ncbi:MAG: protease modulator HflC [Elusimicrobia bacterium]|nr:protease modulator HflC [Elusimicrobiota bacterium]